MFIALALLALQILVGYLAWPTYGALYAKAYVGGCVLGWMLWGSLTLQSRYRGVVAVGWSVLVSLVRVVLLALALVMLAQPKASAWQSAPRLGIAMAACFSYKLGMVADGLIRLRRTGFYR